MTYTIYLHTGEVIRSDGVVVAPAQSTDDPNFKAYIEWIEQGNTPIEVAQENVE